MAAPPSSVVRLTPRVERVEREGLPEAIGDYEVCDELGVGGMGRVLRAYDDRIGRQVAVKLLHRDRERDAYALHKFQQEAQVTGQLDHPYIVPVHELGATADGRSYFTMRPVEGLTLEVVLALEEQQGPSIHAELGLEGGLPRTLNELLEVFVKVCDAVAYAHSRGVIHRDLKPENVMVGRFGEVHVMDWGLAKLRGVSEPTRETRDASEPETDASRAHLTADGDILGTPAYMPPEQALGEIDRIDERSDVYALGGVLYAILTRQPPIPSAPPLQMLEQVAQGQIQRPTERAPQREIPWELEAVVLKAMARQAGMRYRDARALKADVQAFLEKRPLPGISYQGRGAGQLWQRCRRAVLALLTLVVVSAAVGWLVDRQARERERTARDAREASLRAEVEPRLARLRSLEAQLKRLQGEARRGPQREALLAIEGLLALAARGAGQVPVAELTRWRAQHLTALARESAARGDLQAARGWAARLAPPSGGSLVEQLEAEASASAAAASADFDALLARLDAADHAMLPVIERQLGQRLARGSLSTAQRRRLLEHLGDARPAVGAVVARLLGQLPGPEVTRALSAALAKAAERDPSGALELALARSLAATGSADAYPPLREAVRRAEVGSERWLALRATEVLVPTPPIQHVDAQSQRVVKELEDADRDVRRGKYQKAYDRLWDVLQMAPSDLQVRLAFARVRRLLGQLEQAWAEIDVILVREPSTLGAYVERAKLALTRHGADRGTPLAERWLRSATLDVERALSLDAAHPASWTVRGQIEAAKGRLPEARAAFDQAIERAPDDPVARLARARVLYALDEIEAAKADLELTLERSKDVAIRRAAQKLRARVALDAGKAGAARRDLDEVLRRQRRDREALALRAEALVMLDQIEDARADLSTLLSGEAPIEAKLRVHLLSLRARCALAERAWEPAQRDLARALALVGERSDPEAIRARVRLLRLRSQAHERMGDLRAARDDLGKALEVDGEDHGVRLERARLFLRQGMALAAGQDADAVLAKRKDHPLALLLSARAHDRLGKKDRAFALARRALSVRPSFEEARCQIAEWIYRDGNLARAREMVADDTDGLALLTRGRWALLEGRLEDALELLQGAVKRRRRDPLPRYYFALAIVSRMAKREDAALREKDRKLALAWLRSALRDGLPMNHEEFGAEAAFGPLRLDSDFIKIKQSLPR